MIFFFVNMANKKNEKSIEKRFFRETEMLTSSPTSIYLEEIFKNMRQDKRMAAFIIENALTPLLAQQGIKIGYK